MKRILLFSLLLSLPAFATAQSPYQASPTDDVWVYSFAGDQTTDGFLRAWGNGVTSIGPNPPDSNFSYSYLKWDLAAIPNGAYIVQEAKLIVTQQVNATTQPGYTQAIGNANPLEARPVGTNFDEVNWDFTDPANPVPGDPRFGIGDLSNYVAPGTPNVTGFEIPIDLLAGGSNFNAYFNAAVNSDDALALALTSKLLPTTQGGPTYRLYSKDNPLQLGPSLFIRYQAVPEPGAVATLGAFALFGGLAALRRRRR
jgi:hypothetical protein